ncbi:MAG: hypothetical protein JWM52_627 [Candidatus Saccharibacteria bacterium]|nr:hypothetical protein [Candidatus Saccharibacteria bacterium]
MSSPDRETVSSITTDRPVADELEAHRSENETILGYINRVYSSMRYEPAYGPVLSAFNRMGNVTIGIALGDARLVHAPAFVMGQVLGLEAMQLAGEEDVKDKVYQGLNDSYGMAQRVTNQKMKEEVKRREKPELELSFLRPGYMAMALRQEFVEQDVEAKVFDEEVALITMWALELAPDNPKFQQQLIDGYMFVRYRSGEILVKPADLSEMRETFDGIVENTQGERYKEITETSLDSFREGFIANFQRRRSALGDIDMGNKARVDATLDVLSREVKEEFGDQSELELYDRVEIRGPGMVLYRQSSSSIFNILSIRPDQRLQGVLKDVDIGIAPKEEIVQEIYARHASKNAEQTNFDPQPNDHIITPMLNLADVVVIRDDGDVKPFDAGVSIFIPAEYGITKLFKLTETTQD